MLQIAFEGLSASPEFVRTDFLYVRRERIASMWAQSPRGRGSIQWMPIPDAPRPLTEPHVDEGGKPSGCPRDVDEYCKLYLYVLRQMAAPG